ncbi:MULTISPECIES: 4-amino-4-deoxy-L-arabinose-phosphoundecaprenol flippase subunit ArnE [Pectobacterium]|uniref:4-amino-4-deoxy-L-arabinose-phosphoundecaprenol flippase subunit ArnE n=1 Tax=Pectobacterium TaxID=122277 RepID=UPI0015F0A5EA|nr:MULTISPECIES: 4-amino-4-deoxy-L-arabinose-phosphoundecaprenol flippase subunit ArnE [Pectobacterium]MBA5238673.1 EamA family transporter [Pectobacterium aroidearum]MBG0753738.1 putative 4-amino-4-deoxy-L-arabinose-phosphoundecaprenol flippase subunit ArnE [Pectobacterium carotovorum subsp. carotovorum PCCS1]UUE37624.1 SMR family transporter [Pectobacterium aroidearum]UUE42000.1 SMR family transporter [Pectobacterium aroidearum]UUE46294.1 SMR family transporter [Pectobacterium aroidearum]
MSYLLVAIVCLLTSLGQLCQKQAAECWRRLPPDRRQRVTLGWLMLAVVLLGVGLLLWLVVLQHIPLGVAYPLLSINFVLVTLLAHYWFGERVDKHHWWGIALIVTGIYLMQGG